MKKLLLLGTCFVALFAFCGCEKNTEDNQTSEPIVGMANPWLEHETVEDAEKATGFTFDAPDAIDDYKISLVQDMESRMIEIRYSKDDQDDDTIIIRKGTGFNNDISGDYTEYGETTTATIGDYQVTQQGDDGKISLATWKNGEYEYSVSTPGMDKADIETIISQIK